MEVDGNILFNAGTHTDAIIMKYDEWEKLVQPRKASFAVKKSKPSIRSYFRDEEILSRALTA